MKQTKHIAFKHDILRYATMIALIMGAALLLLNATGQASPEMVGMAIISFTFGLQHAFDVDHIAAIDNMTRKMLNDGKNTRGVGFYFSLGHSLVVIIMALITVLLVEWAKNTMPIFEALGGAMGTLIAAIMLIFLAVVNSFIIVNIWLNFKNSQQDTTLTRNDNTSKINKIFLKLLNLIQHNWQVMIVGFLFGLGFDTATQIAVLASSATATNSGAAWYVSLSFPLFFTAGMCFMDTLDGLFMSSTYKWVFSSPYRKVYFNLTITGISILAAGFIGFADLIQALSALLDWNNGVTSWVQALDLNQLGFILVGLFAISWIIALIIWHSLKLSNKDHGSII